MEQRRVVIPIYEGIQPLDVTGPHEVLAGANAALDALGVAAPDTPSRSSPRRPGTVRAPSGLASWLTVPSPGSAKPSTRSSCRAVTPQPAWPAPGGALVEWLRASAPHARRVTTVCSGAFFAAAAGLCDGKRVTTHWSRAGQLAAACPAASVEPDAIYVRDGDCGPRPASPPASTSPWPSSRTTTARAWPSWWPATSSCTSDVPVGRPSTPRRCGASPPPPARSAPPGTSSTPSRARTWRCRRSPPAVGLSPRHFTRLFREQVGEPPARYVERVRIEAACAPARHDVARPRRGRRAHRLRHRRDPAPRLPPPPRLRARRLPPALPRLDPTHHRDRNQPMHIAIALFPRSPRSTPSARTRSCSASPAPTVTFVGEETGEMRSDNGFLGLTVDATFDDVPDPDVVVVPGGVGTRPLMAPGSRHSRLAAQGARDQPLHDVGVHGLARARRRRPARRAHRHHALEHLRGAARASVPSRPGSGSSSTSTGGSSPPPACRPASTWRCASPNCWSTPTLPGRCS